MSEQERDKPRYKLVKPAATGAERAVALARMEAISAKAGARAKADGLTEEQLQAILDEPD